MARRVDPGSTPLLNHQEVREVEERVEPLTPPAGETKETKTKETKEAKFVRLATDRTSKAITRIRAIRSLANRQNYAFTEEQASKIKKALAYELDCLAAAFDGTKQKKEGFSL
jgi:hypothetical protein